MIHPNVQKVKFLHQLKATRQWKNSGTTAAVPAVPGASCLQMDFASDKIRREKVKH